jgi:hypothetical protein
VQSLLFVSVLVVAQVMIIFDVPSVTAETKCAISIVPRLPGAVVVLCLHTTWVAADSKQVSGNRRIQLKQVFLHVEQSTVN